MLKIKLLDNQFYLDTGYDTGTILWMPDKHARLLVEEGHAEFWHDGVPEPPDSKQGKVTVQVKQADSDKARTTRTTPKQPRQEG